MSYLIRRVLAVVLSVALLSQGSVPAFAQFVDVNGVVETVRTAKTKELLKQELATVPVIAMAYEQMNKSLTKKDTDTFFQIVDGLNELIIQDLYKDFSTIEEYARRNKVTSGLEAVLNYLSIEVDIPEPQYRKKAMNFIDNQVYKLAVLEEHIMQGLISAEDVAKAYDALRMQIFKECPHDNICHLRGQSLLVLTRIAMPRYVKKYHLDPKITQNIKDLFLKIADTDYGDSDEDFIMAEYLFRAMAMLNDVEPGKQIVEKYLERKKLTAGLDGEKSSRFINNLPKIVAKYPVESTSDKSLPEAKATHYLLKKMASMDNGARFGTNRHAYHALRIWSNIEIGRYHPSEKNFFTEKYMNEVRDILTEEYCKRRLNSSKYYLNELASGIYGGGYRPDPTSQLYDGDIPSEFRPHPECVVEYVPQAPPLYVEQTHKKVILELSLFLLPGEVFAAPFMAVKALINTARAVRAGKLAGQSFQEMFVAAKERRRLKRLEWEEHAILEEVAKIRAGRRVAPVQAINDLREGTNARLLYESANGGRTASAAGNGARGGNAAGESVESGNAAGKAARGKDPTLPRVPQAAAKRPSKLKTFFNNLGNKIESWWNKLWGKKPKETPVPKSDTTAPIERTLDLNEISSTWSAPRKALGFTQKQWSKLQDWIRGGTTLKFKKSTYGLNGTGELFVPKNLDPKPIEQLIKEINGDLAKTEEQIKKTEATLVDRAKALDSELSSLQAKYEQLQREAKWIKGPDGRYIADKAKANEMRMVLETQNEVIAQIQGLAESSEAVQLKELKHALIEGVERMNGVIRAIKKGKKPETILKTANLSKEMTAQFEAMFDIVERNKAIKLATQQARNFWNSGEEAASIFKQLHLSLETILQKEVQGGALTETKHWADTFRKVMKRDPDVFDLMGEISANENIAREVFNSAITAPLRYMRRAAADKTIKELFNLFKDPNLAGRFITSDGTYVVDETRFQQFISMTLEEMRETKSIFRTVSPKGGAKYKILSDGSVGGAKYKILSGGSVGMEREIQLKGFSTLGTFFRGSKITRQGIKKIAQISSELGIDEVKDLSFRLTKADARDHFHIQILLGNNRQLNFSVYVEYVENEQELMNLVKSLGGDKYLTPNGIFYPADKEKTLERINSSLRNLSKQQKRFSRSRVAEEQKKIEKIKEPLLKGLEKQIEDIEKNSGLTNSTRQKQIANKRNEMKKINEMSLEDLLKYIEKE